MIKVSDAIKIDGLEEKKRESLLELSKDKYVKAFLQRYHLPQSILSDYWIEFLDYRDDKHICENCKGLESCPKENKGMVKELEYVDSGINIGIMNCGFYKKSQEVLNHFVYKNVRDELLLTDLSAYINEHNDKASKQLQNAYIEVMKYLKQPTDQGLFIHGEGYQNEKTKLMAALMNALARKGKDVAFIHFPTFLVDLKASFNQDDSLDWKFMMEVPYLVLDGIGEENVTTYSRDEILLTVLSYRAINMEPTFFTSFYGYKDLQKVYTIKKGDEIKARTLLLKIKAMSKEVVLD